MNNLIKRIRENGNQVFKYSNLIKWGFVGLLVAIFKQRRNTKIEFNGNYTPVFVIGHWRSGTTYLQKCLCSINSFGYISVADISTSCGSEFWTNIFKFLIQSLFSILNVKDKFQRVRFTADMPIEEMHAMMFNNTYDTSSWSFLFPSKAINYFKTYIFDPYNESQKSMDDEYYHIVNKIASRKTNLKVLILKSPENTARIDRLLRAYPNAKFMYIHRDPYDVYHSCLKFWEIIESDFSIQKNMSVVEKESLIINTYNNLMQLYLNQKGTLCSNNLVEIEFESMRQNPYKTITQALKKLNIFDESYTKDLKKFLNASEIKEYKVLDYKTDTMLRVRLETSLRIGYKLWEEIKNPQGV